MFQYTPLFCAGRYLKEIITPFLAAGCIVLVIGAVAKGDVPLTFTEMATDLDEPWSFGFLPDGGYLVTLRGGQLRRYDAGGAFDIVSGLPDIAVHGQGGLLDVLVPSDFADTQQIYFTYSTSQAHGGAGTALARAVLRGNALHDMQILWQLTPGSSGGRHYSGAPIGIGTQAEGMQQPYFYWDPSIAPSGAAFYQGDLFPDWQGDMLVGALSGGVIRLRPGPNMREIGRIETHETARVRDVRVAPDGAIWVLSVGNGALYRITPASQ